MRCSQPQGLPKEAQEFLSQRAKRKNFCPHCQRDDGYESIEIGHVGMFEDVPLNRYVLLKGYAEEFVQHCVWSSGPMEWFGLKVYNDDGKLLDTICWDQAEIDKVANPSEE